MYVCIMYCMSYLCLTCHNITLVTNSCICFFLKPLRKHC